MKDVRFYLEFPTPAAKHKSGRTHTGHSGNVLAAFEPGPGLYEKMHPEGLGALFVEPNSPVACTGYSREFLRQCKRVSERTARAIHPKLFERLDVAEKEVIR